jgi:hypothetical protein
VRLSYRASVVAVHAKSCIIPPDLRLGCGMGRKAPHDTVIPLCKLHHDEFHRLGKRGWEAE